MGLVEHNRIIRTLHLGILCAFGLFLLSLNGCGSLDWFVGKGQEKTPSELMEEGMQDLEGAHYKAATKAFQKIQDRYPYSKFAVLAELKTADTLFIRASYNEAYGAYRNFEKLHPKNQEIPYVIYQEGMCNYRQMSSIDRDQTHSLKAKEDFSRLVRRFPDNVYASRARMRIRDCYRDLAKHELYVGRFYFKNKDYRAAASRFRYAIAHYPDVGQYYEALQYLGRCEEQLARK